MRFRFALKSNATFWLGICFFLGIALCGSITAADRPDVVVFLSDDHSQLDSTPYGATDVRTPNMDRLAKSGLLFTHAFVASPSCAPSRNALLTGLMPARNGAENNHSMKRAGIRSLPRVLREMGYQTVAFGKVAHGKDEASKHGFEVSEQAHDKEHVEKFLTERRDRSRPLCMFVGTHEPHVPWLENRGYEAAQLHLPPTHIDTPETREFRAKYYTDVTDADRRLGEVMDLVDQHLNADSTLFMYTSDHGAQWPFGKWNLYDAGIRVPMLVRWPKHVSGGQTSAAMIQWIDLLPTIIDFAGGTIPDGIDGQSFLATIKNSVAPHRERIFTTHSGDGRMNVYPIRSVRTDRWKLIWNLHPEFAHTTHIDKALARDGGRYWISWFEKAQHDPAAAQIVKRYHERPEYELYDLQSDPYEQHNLAFEPAHAQLLSELQASLKSWMETQGDQRTVFAEPRLLSDPASTQPGPKAAE